MSLACSRQQRQHRRIEVEWPVTMMTPEGDMDGIIENISVGGAYIRCETMLSKSDLFLMCILAHSRKGSWLGAEVIWIDIPLDADTESVPVGMGVRFTDMSEDDLRFITEAVADDES